MALNKKQEKAIVLLFEQKTNIEVARIIGVYESTIYRWLNNDEFQRELQSYTLNHVARHLPELINNMIDLANRARSEMVRFNATKDLLDRANVIPKDETDDDLEEAEIFVDWKETDEEEKD